MWKVKNYVTKGASYQKKLYKLQKKYTTYKQRICKRIEQNGRQYVIRTFYSI